MTDDKRIIMCRTLLISDTARRVWSLGMGTRPRKHVPGSLGRVSVYAGRLRHSNNGCVECFVDVKYSSPEVFGWFLISQNSPRIRLDNSWVITQFWWDWAPFVVYSRSRNNASYCCVFFVPCSFQGTIAMPPAIEPKQKLIRIIRAMQWSLRLRLSRREGE